MLVTFVVWLAVAVPVGAALEARFIGNAGFEVSDGRTTLLIDFPYRSGAYGYMTFDGAELQARSDSLCLFTHGHADHFDPEAIAGIGCVVLGPADVLQRVGVAVRLDGGPKWRFRNLELECLTTDHGGVDHCSWIVRWQHRFVVIAGDVEHLDGLVPHLDDLDVVVIPAWLSSHAGQIRARFPRAKIVIGHHQRGDDLSACDECLVPAQGTVLAW